MTLLPVFLLLAFGKASSLEGLESESSCDVKVSGEDFPLRRASVMEVTPSCSEVLTEAETCAACGMHHAPCEGTFVGCRGCCHQAAIPSDINCDDIVAFYKGENTCKLKMESANSAVPQKVGLVPVQQDGQSFQLCGSTPQRTFPTHTPALVEFQCEQCNKGNPDLLKKCCDECVDFTRKKFPQVLTFVKCAGCEVTSLDIAKYNQSVHFKYHDLYTHHHPAVVTARFEQWIRNNVCPKSEPSCPHRRLSSLSYSKSCANSSDEDDDDDAGNITESPASIMGASTTHGADFRKDLPARNRTEGNLKVQKENKVDGVQDEVVALIAAGCVLSGFGLGTALCYCYNNGSDLAGATEIPSPNDDKFPYRPKVGVPARPKVGVPACSWQKTP